MELQIIGGGKMGQALAGGLLGSGWLQASDLLIVEVDADRRAYLRNALTGVEVNEQPMPGVDAILAVKPWLVTEAAMGLDGSRRIMSIAAGVPISAIESVLGPGSRVLRAMPNTPALIGAGASAVAKGSSADDDDLAWGVGILSAVGKVEVVTEAQMDAVTGLSGSGPAYIFLVAEALIDAGVTAGLPRQTAETLAVQTMLGAARMLDESSDPAGELRMAVTTPAGTTAAGLQVLEQAAFRGALIDAVAAASARSRELRDAT